MAFVLRFDGIVFYDLVVCYDLVNAKLVVCEFYDLIQTVWLR